MYNSEFDILFFFMYFDMQSFKYCINITLTVSEIFLRGLIIILVKAGTSHFEKKKHIFDENLLWFIINM